MDAATLTAGATIVLVAVTIYYAWQTHRTVAEMEKARALTERTITEMVKGRDVTHRTVAEMVQGRELALMPTLTCRLVVDHERARWADAYPGSAVLTVAADYTDLLLGNVGNAPALDVAVRAEADPPDAGRLRLHPLDRAAGIIGCGDTWRQAFTFTQELAPLVRALSDPQAPLDACVVVHASYANVYGRQFALCATFALVGGPDGLAWEQRAGCVDLIADANSAAVIGGGEVS